MGFGFRRRGGGESGASVGSLGLDDEVGAGATSLEREFDGVRRLGTDVRVDRLRREVRDVDPSSRPGLTGRCRCEHTYGKEPNRLVAQPSGAKVKVRDGDVE